MDKPPSAKKRETLLAESQGQQVEPLVNLLNRLVGRKLQYNDISEILAATSSEIRDKVETAMRVAGLDRSSFDDARRQLAEDWKKLAAEKLEFAEEQVSSRIENRIEPKTGLLSGQYFNKLFAQIMISLCSEGFRHHDRRFGSPTLIVGDVRDMKLYNDVLPGHGHDLGDALLAAAGATIRSKLRWDNPVDPDWAARSNIAGDEIEILLAKPRSPVEAERIAGRIVDAFRNRSDWTEFDHRLNQKSPWVDFGIAAVKGTSLRGILKGLNAKDLEEKVADLIEKWRKLADARMYETKFSEGRIISFGWYEYIDGEFVDITAQAATIPGADLESEGTFD